MKKKSGFKKKATTVAMASVMALGLAALPGMNSYADTYVVIGNAFPDETFAQYVHEKFDTDTDGALNDEREMQLQLSMLDLMESAH